ncbi:MAG: tetrahydrofolate synthase [Crocinitomicaceae bacterium]|nr:tetrahydrofolate synthase [Crocinitomicaceae bacterium]
MTNYKEIVAFLYKQYPSFQKKGISAYRDNLDNIEKLCEIIGNPQKSIKTIHVAGTNGKGSVCNMIYNIYKKNGYKVGLFTSPHLFDFRERIIINDVWISKDYIMNFYEKNFQLFKEIKPSFFEWTTVLAFSYYKYSATDINIIETGLGGRLDSTNIINPEISIITNIGLDHQNILGNTLEEIAKEKAGIIKENTPTLLGPNIKAKSIFEDISKAKNSSLYVVGNNLDQDESSLPEYQLKNWETAKKATQIINSRIKIHDKVSDYLTIKGRWQIVENNPKTILDIGHNKDCIIEAQKQLLRENYEKLHLIIGFSNDKNIDEILDVLPIADYIYATQSVNERSLDPEILKNKLKLNNKQIFEDYKNAFESAQIMASKEDLVLITGSAFLVGDILKEFY